MKLTLLVGPPGAVFPMLLNRSEAVDKYVRNKIRPKGNILKSFE